MRYGCSTQPHLATSRPKCSVKCSGFFTGRDPMRGSGRIWSGIGSDLVGHWVGFGGALGRIWSGIGSDLVGHWVGSSRVRKCWNSFTGRVGLGGFQISRVGPASRDPTTENACLFFSQMLPFFWVRLRKSGGESTRVHEISVGSFLQ